MHSLPLGRHSGTYVLSGEVQGPLAAGNRGLSLEPGPPKSAAGHPQAAPPPASRTGANTGRESLVAMASVVAKRAVCSPGRKALFVLPPRISAAQSPGKPEAHPQLTQGRSPLPWPWLGTRPELAVPCPDPGQACSLSAVCAGQARPFCPSQALGDSRAKALLPPTSPSTPSCVSGQARSLGLRAPWARRCCAGPR